MESERIEKVEIKLSYLEETVDQLNGIVAAQQKEMEKLAGTIESLQKKIAELVEETGGDIPDRRPPHY